MKIRSGHVSNSSSSSFVINISFDKKVVCIDIEPFSNLKVGEWYDVMDENLYHYKINGVWYLKRLFVDNQGYRKRKLEKLESL